ncbi:MAG TPA: phosphatidylglycerophosphatase A [Verrucomicrobiae bacterium]|nr:phosphatidylglycerophosphatase A [Verrucomicrobiae bacterium]
MKKSTFLLWLAQGFGSGRAPVAPGTFGSAAGLLWFLVLLWLPNPWLFLLACALGLLAAAWLCGEGERILCQKDPGSVVMDEIAAIPLCFAAWLIFDFTRSGAMPAAVDFFGPHRWMYGIAVFALFRFFDVVKPWPVRQSQAVPGGWGIMIDDALAAVYVNIVVGACYLARHYLSMRA